MDAVVCNPPYVAEEARDTLPADVLAEPPLAVFGGIEIYERLFAQAVGWLAPGGIVAVEIEETAAEVVSKAAAHQGFEGITRAPRPHRPGPRRGRTTAAPVTPLEGPLGEAAAAARRGELIVFPTDTVYGLGTRPDDRAATARVFAAKQQAA